MNTVPIAIGKRNDALYSRALAVATEYGTVPVFHGDETNCEVWNAAEALQDPRARAASVNCPPEGIDKESTIR